MCVNAAVRCFAPPASASVSHASAGHQVSPVQLSFTSEAEQKWLQERDARAQAEAAAAAKAEANARRSFDAPPPPFVSSLGFRDPAPFPAQPAALKAHCHQDGVSREFFWGGTGRFVSENGTANAQMYFRLARPLAGRLKSHQVSRTTMHGYSFDQYTSRP